MEGEISVNVLVIGCGRLGRRLAELLDEHGHDVAVVDSEVDNFRMLDEDFNGMTVTGFPMEMKVLRTAGIESCDAVAVCTPDDNLNITISQIAREFFNVRNVVARISDPGREKVFKRFGLKTVCHTKLAGDAMFAALTQPWDSREVTFGTATVAFHVKEADRSWVGQSVTRLPCDPGETPFGLVHADGTMQLSAGRKDLYVTDNDRIVFAMMID